MRNSAHCSPVIVRADHKVDVLTNVRLKQDNNADTLQRRREHFIQELVHKHPRVLPMDDIEHGFTDLVPISMELNVGDGYLDNLWMTREGGIVLGECKLVGNPQARREVLVQALNYASTISEWSYEEFERAVAKTRPGTTLWSILHPGNDDVDEEARFIDSVQDRLRNGRFVILLILDGVKDGLETLSAYLQRHAGMHTNIAIVELSIWSDGGGDWIVIPRVPLRTQLVERGIVINRADGRVQVVEAASDQKQSAVRSFTSSEIEFFARLDQNVPGIQIQLKTRLLQLGEYGIDPEYRRSLILRWVISSEKIGSLGYIDAWGVAWFGDAFYTAKRFGNEVAGRNYLQALADLIGGTVKWPSTDNSQLSLLGSSGKTARIDEFLRIGDKWIVEIQALLKHIPKDNE